MEKTSNLDLQTQELQSEGTTSVDCTSLTDIINAIIDDQVTFTLEPYDLNGVNCITNPLTTTSIHCQSCLLYTSNIVYSYILQITISSANSVMTLTILLSLTPHVFGRQFVMCIKYLIV